MDEELELQHVYGFAGHAARRLAALNAAGDCVWAAGNLVVVQRCSAAVGPLPTGAPMHPLQRFFSEHPAPVTTLAAHPNGRYFASGDAGVGPILVWDSHPSAIADSTGRVTVEIRRVAAVGDGRGRGAGVAAMSFGWDGAALVTVGRDTLHMVQVWDWAAGVVLAAAAAGVTAVLGLACGAGPNRAEFVTSGAGQVIREAKRAQAARRRRGPRR